MELSEQKQALSASVWHMRGAEYRARGQTAGDTDQTLSSSGTSSSLVSETLGKIAVRCRWETGDSSSSFLHTQSLE